MLKKSEINKEIDKTIKGMKNTIKELSKEKNIPEQEVEQKLRETFEGISEPTLDNIDYPHYGKYNFNMDEFKSE